MKIEDNNDKGFEDMYSSEEDRNQNQNIKQIKEQSKKQAKKQSANYANKILNFGKKAGEKSIGLAAKGTAMGIRYLLPYIIAAIAAIVALIFIVSVIAFLITGPSSMMKQIGKMSDELWTSFKDALVTEYKSFAYGDDYANVSKQNILDVANYIDLMGYDLIGYGFVRICTNK